MFDIGFRFTADASGVDTGINKMKASFSSLNGVLGAIGAGISVGGFVALGKQAIDAGSEIHDMAKRLGVSYGDMQRFKFAAEQSGTSMESVARASLKMGRSTVTAMDALRSGKSTYTEMNENGEMVVMSTDKISKAFATLGINVTEFSALSPTDQFITMADALQQNQGSAEATDAAFTIMGKGVADLLPLLYEGGEGLRAMFAEAPVMIDETIDSLDRAGDSIAKLKTTMVSWAGTAIDKLQHVTGMFGVMIEQLWEDDVGRGRKPGEGPLDYAWRLSSEKGLVDEKTPEREAREKRKAEEKKAARESARESRLAAMKEWKEKPGEFIGPMLPKGAAFKDWLTSIGQAPGELIGPVKPKEKERAVEEFVAKTEMAVDSFARLGLFSGGGSAGINYAQRTSDNTAKMLEYMANGLRIASIPPQNALAA